MTLRGIIISGWIGFAGLLAGCDGTSAAGPAGKTSADGRLGVVATVAMVGNVVETVAGDDAAVETLIGTGVDPHLYRPTRDDVRKLHDAQVVFYSGYHLEGRMADMLHELARSKPSVAVAERANIGVAEPDNAASHDPHAWMDPSLWAKTADPIVETLAAARPEHRAGFEQRAAEFKRQCETLKTYGDEIMQTVPAERRVLVTSHDAFRYFSRSFGLRELSLQGLSTESEASLRKINDVANEVVRLKVPAVFIESSVPAKSVQSLIDACGAQGHTVVIGGELFSDAMGAAGTYEGTYVGMIDHNLTTIVRALGGQAPERGLNGKLSATHATTH